MRKNPRRILSPQRLPFRHPGDWPYKLIESNDLVQHNLTFDLLLKRSGVNSGVSCCTPLTGSKRCAAPMKR